MTNAAAPTAPAWAEAVTLDADADAHLVCVDLADAQGAGDATMALAAARETLDGAASLIVFVVAPPEAAPPNDRLLLVTVQTFIDECALAFAPTTRVCAAVATGLGTANNTKAIGAVKRAAAFFASARSVTGQTLRVTPPPPAPLLRASDQPPQGALS